MSRLRALPKGPLMTRNSDATFSRPTEPRGLPTTTTAQRTHLDIQMPATRDIETGRSAMWEPDLRAGYERKYPNSTWDKMKDSVRYGWNRVTGKV